MEHQFSTTNQPSRRRKKRRRKSGTDLLEQLLNALDQTIEVTRKGKPARVTAMEALMQQLIAKTLQGGPGEQRKLIELLNKAGYFDFAASREELEESHSHVLAEKDAEYTKVLEYLVESVAITNGLMRDRRFVGEALLSAQKRCSCGSFDEFEEWLGRVEEWLVDEDEEGPEDAAVAEGALSWTPGHSAGDVSDEHWSPDEH